MRLSTKFSIGLLFVAQLVGNAAHARITNPAVVAAVEQAAPPGLTVIWDDPSYLLEDFGFTPVVEAGLARFRAANGVDKAAILILVTETSAENPSGLYPHDYRVCQSIHAASLINLSPFTSALGGKFLLMEMSRPSVHEYAATFLIRDHEGTLFLDSQLLSSMYTAGLSGKQYTFQTWSDQGDVTKALVAQLLGAFQEQQPLIVENVEPRLMPIAVARRVQLIGDTLLLEIQAPAGPIELDVTVVSWVYPNSTPTVATVTESMLAGRSLHVVPVPQGTTDAEVYLGYEGILQDKVLASFNGWGPLTSGWYPFSDAAGSVVGIKPVPASGLLPKPREVVANPATVRLEGNLATGGFVGIYLDLLPALQGAPDLRSYDRLILRTRQAGPNSNPAIEIKMELDDGTSTSSSMVTHRNWTTTELSLDAFGDWQDIGARAERMVLAVTSPPGPVSVDVDRISFRRVEEPQPVLPSGADLPGTPLMLEKSQGPGLVELTWSASCTGGDTDYEIYQGIIGDFASHAPLVCSTWGETHVVVEPNPGDGYFLVVPRNATREGSYGLDSTGALRPASVSACLMQLVGTCP